MNSKRRYHKYAQDIATVSMCTALIIISSWISIPFPISFTLQTLAIFIVCLLFDFKISFISVLLYVFMGIVGVPVFSGFNTGFSFIVGPTGGFILSFLLFPFFISTLKRSSFILATVVCTLLCYIIGTLWFCFIYSGSSGMNIISILAICIFPFVIPDTLKVLLACTLCKRLSKIKLKKQ